MAGYGVYTVYGQRYPESRSINPYHAVSTEQAQSAKDLSYGKRTLFSCKVHCVTSGRRDSEILLAWVANHSAAFNSSCLPTELDILTIKIV